MNLLKVALLWTNYDFERTVIFNLIKKFSKKKIVFVKPIDSDLTIFGSYYANDKMFFFYKFLRHFIKNKNFLSYINDHQKKLINSFFLRRRYKPVTLFYNTEILDYNNVEADYYISGHLGIKDENHLSFNLLKEDIDWSSEHDLARSKGGIMFDRYGGFIKQEKLLSPQGDFFLKKRREMLFVINNLIGSRKEMYNIFSKKFNFHTFGNAFGNNKDIKISTLQKNYSFSFCPEHYCIPFFSGSRVAYAFQENSLPITFLNYSANRHLNKAAFVNLNDHFYNNFEKIIINLKSDDFLRSFCNQPLLFKKLDLSNEIKFIKKIIDCL